MGYIRDGFNPRGAEYAATARAADAARATQKGMDDMLALAMATDPRSRAQVAYDIQARRQREASRRSFRNTCSLVACVLFVAAVVGVFYLGSLSDADTPAIFKAPTNVSAQ